MHLIFLNRFFHPDHSATSQMLSDLAFALAGSGHEVRVITSRQRYDAPEVVLPARETLAGVDVHRVWTSRLGRQNLVGRAVDYATFYLSAAWALWRLARRDDVIVAKTDPPMLSVVVAPIARWHGAKLVNWLQDLFPEIAEAVVGGGRLSRLGYGMMRVLRSSSLRRAVFNVALGERMAERLVGLGIAPARLRIIPNWADGNLVKPVEHSGNQLRSGWDLAGKFVVGYSGNLGRAHEYATLLEAIERLEEEVGGSMRGEESSGSSIGAELHRCAVSSLEGLDARPQIVWLFIGGGALYDAFKREVAKRRLTSVKFEPYQPRERLAESLSAADVHLVSLRPELEGLIVPSKFYGIAAAGRPAIFVGDKDGEIARHISMHDCGRTVAQGDGAGLAATLVELANNPGQCREMGIRARLAFEAEFDKAVAVSRWQALLNEVAGGKQRRGRHLTQFLGAFDMSILATALPLWCDVRLLALVEEWPG